MAFKSNDDGKFIQDTVGKNALAADGNGDDEDQADCNGLNTELANKIEIGKEELIKSDNDEWIKISKPNQDEEGRDNECQSSTSIKADKKGTENPAINLGILDKSDTDQLTPGTCRSAEDETESNEDEACNSCKNANGQRLNGDTVENMDIGNHPLSDSWDTGSSVDNFSANFQRISGANKKLTENVQHLSTLANKLQEENNKNLAQINRVNEEVNSLQSQVQQLKNQDKQSTVHIQQLQKDLQKKSKRLNSCENENEKFKRDNAEFKKSTKQLQDEIKKQKQENSDLRKHIEAISGKFDEQKRQTDDFKQYAEKLKLSWQNFYADQSNQWEQSRASMTAELERHKIELQNNREEHSNLLTRYSKLAGETLSMGNANVSDLSDPNRPTKLAEQFSELYDNDWTDAFEELSHLDEEERISLLLKILQRAYELSADMAATQWLTQCYYTTNENYVHKGADTCNMVTKGPGNSKESTEKESIDRTETVSASANETLLQDPNQDEDLYEIEKNGMAEAMWKNTPSDLSGPVNSKESTVKESNDKSDTESTSANETLFQDPNQDEDLKEIGTNGMAEAGWKITPFNSSGPGNGEESTEQESNNRAETESTSANETLFQDPNLDEDLKEIGTNGMAKVGWKITPSYSSGPGNGEESTEQESNNKAETESTSANETLGPGNGEESTEQESNNRAETQSTSANETLGPGNSEESTEKKSNDRAETETASPNETSVVVHVSEAIQQRKLNMLEMPVQKLDLNEREQGAVKVFAHIKKKILSSHSHLLQMVIKECLMKEFEIIAKEDGETTKLLDYVTKCCNICLLMCVKAPPLYINFLTDTTNHEKISFNNEQYKPYTKKGKYIQFLVWPCLFLEKNGPILAKGIAQGGDEL